MVNNPEAHDGHGATKELSLRVSLATLARVLFKHPKTGKNMLDLERKASLYQAPGGEIIEIKSQPFGGAIRIKKLAEMQNIVGDFHFDSARSKSEQDFRIFIRPSRWPRLRDFAIEHLRYGLDPILETGPERELLEEFEDALQIHLHTEQFTSQPVGLVLEEHPSPTMNISAIGFPSVRIYSVHEVKIIDEVVAEMMVENSEVTTDQDLRQLALDDAQGGGRGRANAVLTLPYAEIQAFYQALSLDERIAPVSYQQTLLDGNVLVILDHLSSLKYQHL